MPFQPQRLVYFRTHLWKDFYVISVCDQDWVGLIALEISTILFYKETFHFMKVAKCEGRVWAC